MMWYEQAADKLNRETPSVKGQKESLMKDKIRDFLLELCRQNEEFAQAVAQGGSFQACMSAVVKGTGNYIAPDVAINRASAFYFDGARVEFQMHVYLEPAQASEEPRSIVIDLTDFF